MTTKKVTETTEVNEKINLSELAELASSFEVLDDRRKKGAGQKILADYLPQEVQELIKPRMTSKEKDQTVQVILGWLIREHGQAGVYRTRAGGYGYIHPQGGKKIVFTPCGGEDICLVAGRDVILERE